MNSDFARALREATALTRAGKLPDATRLIQAALSKRTSLSGPPNGNETSDTASQTGEVRQIGLAASGDGIADSAHRHRSEASGGRFSQPFKRSLGEVVKALRLAKLRGLAPNPFPGVKARRTPASPEGAQFLNRSFS
jgi:hypothetical protein